MDRCKGSLDLKSAGLEWWLGYAGWRRGRCRMMPGWLALLRWVMGERVVPLEREKPLEGDSEGRLRLGMLRHLVINAKVWRKDTTGWSVEACKPLGDWIVTADRGGWGWVDQKETQGRRWDLITHPCWRKENELIGEGLQKSEKVRKLILQKPACQWHLAHKGQNQNWYPKPIQSPVLD